MGDPGGRSGSLFLAFVGGWFGPLIEERLNAFEVGRAGDVGVHPIEERAADGLVLLSEAEHHSADDEFLAVIDAALFIELSIELVLKLLDFLLESEEAPLFIRRVHGAPYRPESEAL